MKYFANAKCYGVMPMHHIYTCFVYGIKQKNKTKQLRLPLVREPLDYQKAHGNIGVLPLVCSCFIHNFLV